MPYKTGESVRKKGLLSGTELSQVAFKGIGKCSYVVTDANIIGVSD